MYLIPLCLVLLEGLLSSNGQMIPNRRFLMGNRPLWRFPPPPIPGGFDPRLRFPGNLRGAVNQPPQFWNNNRAIPGRQTSDRMNPNNRLTGQNLVRPPFGAVQQQPGGAPGNNRFQNAFANRNQNTFLRPAVNRNDLSNLRNDFNTFQQMRNIPQFPTDLFARRNSPSAPGSISPFSPVPSMFGGQMRGNTPITGSPDNSQTSRQQQQQQQQQQMQQQQLQQQLQQQQQQLQQQQQDLERQRQELQQSLLRRQQALQLAQQQQQPQQTAQQIPAVPQFNQQPPAQQAVTAVPPAANPWQFPDNTLPLDPTNIIRSLPPVSGSTNNELPSQTQIQPQTIQTGSMGSSSPTEHVFDGHLTHQQALDRFAAPTSGTGTGASGDPAMPGAEISHTLITIKDEQGNVIAEQLFPEGSSDATIEEYISRVSANYTNQVRQGGSGAPATGLGTAGNTAASLPPVGGQEPPSAAAVGAPSGQSATNAGTDLPSLFQSFLENPSGFRGVR